MHFIEIVEIICLVSFSFSSFTYSTRFLYFMNEIEKAGLVYFSFSPFSYLDSFPPSHKNN
jgi:hypothetical protein